MLNLLVYNSDEENAQILNEKCDSHIRKNSRKIENAGWYSAEEKFSDAVMQLQDTSLFMVKKKDASGSVSDTISFFSHPDYTVLVLDSPDEMFDAVTPKLRPAGLILESFDEERVGRTVDEIYEDYLRVTERSGGPSYHFKIKGVDYTESFPNIYMIEVQSKKITFHTDAQTYEFYDSLDAVLKEAPDYFVRIHRSIVINANFIRDVNFPEKLITLRDNQEIYFSRNYAGGLKESYFRFRNEEDDS